MVGKTIFLLTMLVDYVQQTNWTGYWLPVKNVTGYLLLQISWLVCHFSQVLLTGKLESNFCSRKQMLMESGLEWTESPPAIG